MLNILLYFHTEIIKFHMQNTKSIQVIQEKMNMKENSIQDNP